MTAAVACSRKKTPGPPVPWMIKAIVLGLEFENAGHQPRGTWNASILNEGVGEHVRTRFHVRVLRPKALRPVKLRTLKIRTERRKLVSSAGPFFEKSELFLKVRSSRLT